MEKYINPDLVVITILYLFQGVAHGMAYAYVRTRTYRAAWLAITQNDLYPIALVCSLALIRSFVVRSLIVLTLS